MKTIRRLGLMGLLAVCLTGCVLFDKDKLAAGGAYAQSETAAAMPELFVTDASFDLAYQALDTAFKYERDNRQLLWQLSPDIKKRMDALRTEANRVATDYAVARQTYLAQPTPVNLSNLNTVLRKLQQANTAALAVIASKGR